MQYKSQILRRTLYCVLYIEYISIVEFSIIKNMKQKVRCCLILFLTPCFICVLIPPNEDMTVHLCILLQHKGLLYGVFTSNGCCYPTRTTFWRETVIDDTSSRYHIKRTPVGIQKSKTLTKQFETCVWRSFHLCPQTNQSVNLLSSEIVLFIKVKLENHIGGYRTRLEFVRSWDIKLVVIVLVWSALDRGI